jgi:nucleoside-diphosphate-sugar epimerase
MKVIVTGSSGFIGSHLTKILISLNKEVIAVSRRKSCYTNHTFMFYNKLIGFSNNKNCLVHLAGSNLNTNSEINEDKKVIQELSRAYKNKMIYISSSAVYGNNSLNKVNELCKTNPLTNYAKNKLICEKEVIRNGGTVLRISNVFGARMSDKSVFYDILNQLHKNTICLANFSAERDFIFIDDVCNAIKSVIDNPIAGIYNVSTGDGTKIKKICDIILDLKGLDKVKFQYVSKNIIQSRLVLDPILFKKTFKWNTKISLYQGINKLLNKET